MAWTPIPNRFWRHVNKTDTCWLWTGAVRDQYGGFTVNGKMRSAHRYSWELHNGPIPAGYWIDHLCRTKLCVNPAHLQPVSPRESQIRNTTAGRHRVAARLATSDAVDWHPQLPGLS